MTNIPEDAIYETWDRLRDMSLELAALIEADCRQRREQFDALLVIPRGSYYPANIISRELGFEATDILHACVSSYKTASTQRQPSFKLGQMPAAEDVRGKAILIIEEVCDTGYTLDYIGKFLREAGAGQIRTAVLHYKPSCSQTGFQPDWFITETDKWIVYPWEVSESRGNLKNIKISCIIKNINGAKRL